jgi:hypothetical protein
MAVLHPGPHAQHHPEGGGARAHLALEEVELAQGPALDPEQTQQHGGEHGGAAARVLQGEARRREHGGADHHERNHAEQAHQVADSEGRAEGVAGVLLEAGLLRSLDAVRLDDLDAR